MSERARMDDVMGDWWKAAASTKEDAEAAELACDLCGVTKHSDLRIFARQVALSAILAERKRCDIECQAAIDEYVTAERQRCANSVWDFYYGEKRGHVTPEEFAEFLQRNPKP